MQLLKGFGRRRQLLSSPARCRVLIIVQNLSVPLDRRVWLECLALRAAGCDVSVICPRADDAPAYHELQGVHIYGYEPPSPATGLTSYVREFVYCWLMTARLSIRVLREHGFDVVQACNPPDTYWLLGAIYKLLLRKKFVFDHHDLSPEVYRSRFGRQDGLLVRALLWLERQTMRTADVVISTNDSYKDIAVRRGKRAPGDVFVVRSGPDPDRMRRGEAEPALKSGRDHLACWLGIMGPQDGVDGLLHIIDTYVRGLGRTDCHFALLGFGDCLADLQRQCTAMGLDEYVTFTGRADATMISRYLSTASVGLGPDPANPLNELSTMNKTMEYMAYELPVITYDLHETRVSAADAAVYVPPGDVTRFAKELASLLEDEPRRRTLGRRGRRRVEDCLAWQHQRVEYLRALERVSPVPLAHVA